MEENKFYGKTCGLIIKGQKTLTEGEEKILSVSTSGAINLSTSSFSVQNPIKITYFQIKIIKERCAGWGKFEKNEEK